MNKKLSNVLLFTAGATIGSAVTWYVVKTKYERLIQEEIDSVKETWSRIMSDNNDEDSHEDDIQDDLDEYDEEPEEGESYGEEEFTEAERFDYSRLTSMYKQPSEPADNGREGEGDDDEVPYINGPYVIAPEDFGDGNFDHDLHCLTYYEDGVLANDWWETFDVDETIGLESVEHFGEHVDDVLHVRNERLKADYEIARDYRNFADLVANDPLMRAYED